MHSRLNWLVYDTTYWLTKFALTLGWSLRAVGRENIPKTGPVLMVANHESYLDPPMIGVSCSRRMAYLARKPLFSNPAFGRFLRLLNAVPIDQEGVAKEGIKNIINRLNEGWPVVVFPEGARTFNGDLGTLQPGVSLLIKKLSGFVVPVGVAGPFAAWPRQQKMPHLAPLFLPPSRRTLGVAYGPPRTAESLACLPREVMLRVLEADIRKAMIEAEKIRRK